MAITQSPGDVLHAVTLHESVFDALHDLIPHMDDDQLIATYQRADELGKRAWLVQAHCLWEARQRKCGYHDDVVPTLANAFGISKQWANQLCGAWEAVPSEIRISDGDLPLAKSFYVVAGQTSDPQGYAALAEDRKAQDPRYSVRDFRADIEAEEAGVFVGGDWGASSTAPRLAVHHSSASPEWYTPRSIVDVVLTFFETIDLDPCSNSDSDPAVPSLARFVQEDDGLSRQWWGRVYVNPPYGRGIGAWIEKACAAFESRAIEAAILLVPARTDTEWWRRMRDYPICLIDGRLRFLTVDGEVAPAPFPSALVYLGDEVDRYAAAVASLGDVWVRHQGVQQ